MKTRKMMKVMTAACLAVLMTAFAGCGKKEAATSGQGGKIEYKLAYHLPADHPLAKGVESFIQKVKEKTHGEVTITAYPAGQLYNDKSMNDAIMTGGVDMGLNTVGRWATVVPAMEVFDVPFVFPSYEKIDQAIDGGMGRTLVTNHASPEFILAMNDRSFAKMSKEQQDAFMEAAKEVQEETRKNAKAMDEKGLADLKAKGMEIYVVPEDELIAWRKATKSVWDTFLKHTGSIGKTVLDMAVKV